MVYPNFSGKNLQGRSFEGQNLTNANFSDANICGVNFSRAILTGANFSNAKAGLRFWQKVVLTLVALSGSTFLGLGSLVFIFCGAVLFPYSLGSSDGGDPIIQESSIIAAGAFIVFFATIVLFGKGLKEASAALIVMGMLFGLLMGSLSGTTAGWVAGIVSMNISVWFGVAMLSLMPIALSGVAQIAGLRAMFLAVGLAWLSGIIGTILGIETTKEVGTLIAGSTELPQKITAIVDDAQEAGLIISSAIALISGYVAWRSWYGDRRFIAISKAVVAFSAIGGTNFRQADLRDADFRGATLHSTDFSNAILTRTNFYGVKKLDRAILNNTILDNLEVRKLLTSGQGAGLSLVGYNLKGANLANADLREINLADANLEAATLEGAILEKANLSKTRALAANFTSAQFSGACLEDWHIDRHTQLERVRCDYIYLRSGERDRRPANGIFKSGQFTKFYNNNLNYIFRKDLEIKPDLVLLKIDRGNFKDGFSVTLQIGKEGETYSKQISGQLSSAPEIPQYYREWQSIYNNGLKDIFRHLKVKYRKIEVINIEPTNFSIEDFLNECWQTRVKFEQSLNCWLNNEVFRPIKEELLQYLNPEASVRTIVQIDRENEILRRLPWHLWDFFDRYPRAEIAVSTLAHQKPNLFTTSRSTLKNKVKILAILGDSTGINIDKDKDFLEQIPDAEITFKCEPNRRELHEKLWMQPWDILFFAGHSSSSLGAETGQIQINPKESLKMPDLKYALKKAVKQGLQLAIFNSCDGLGLARDLSDLDIPQVIVMREPVPDLVAQEFLKNFLIDFARGNSLYNAVRQAREKLESLEDEFPCATWLPVIYQNPAVIPPIWQDLRR